MSAASPDLTGAQGDGAADLFRTLRSLGVVLVVDGERLPVRAPRGVLTPALRAALGQEREELRALVAAHVRGPTTCVVARGDMGLVQPCWRMSPCARPVDDRPCLVPATCCVCSEALPPGHRYLCPACAKPAPSTSVLMGHQGDIEP